MTRVAVFVIAVFYVFDEKRTLLSSKYTACDGAGQNDSSGACMGHLDISTAFHGTECCGEPSNFFMLSVVGNQVLLSLIPELEYIGLF